MAAKGLGNCKLPGGAKRAAKMAAVSSRVLTHCRLLTLAAAPQLLAFVSVAVLRMAIGLVHEYH
jgi:hypothetical protein